MKVNGIIEIDETSEEFDDIRESIRKDIISDLKHELEPSEVVDILTEFGKPLNPRTLCEILKTVTANITNIHTEEDYHWDDEKTGFKKLLAIKNILDI